MKKVNTALSGHLTSTPYRHSPPSDMFPPYHIKETPVEDISMIYHHDHRMSNPHTNPRIISTPSSECPSHLNESVCEILNESLQGAIPDVLAYGPTPHEYKEYVKLNWPRPSGERWGDFADYRHMYDQVYQTALPNFLAARLPIPSGLHIGQWRKHLTNYPDRELIDYLEFGFPSNYSALVIPTPTFTNHHESKDFTRFIRDYIQTECRLGALLGPFVVPPFTPWTQVSPMMTREKADPSKRRVIVDLSYPKGKSVNAGIPRREYLGRPWSYSLPTVSQVGARMAGIGKGTYLWSADVSRAYRQLRTDPLSAPLFGITFEDSIYIDIALPFGCRSSGAACVRMTSAIAWIMAQMGYYTTVYVDDFIGAEPSYLAASKAFNNFIRLCELLGIDLAKDKCFPPCVRLIWLGFHLDAECMSISIPKEKLEKVLKECDGWLRRPKASKKALQSLVGRLNHISSCISPGRKFLSRVLRALSKAHNSLYVQVDDELRRDVSWFRQFAKQFNGVSLIPPKVPPVWLIECDSCLTGGGAYSPKTYFAEEYDHDFAAKFNTIHELEAINLVEAVASLSPVHPQGLEISINTDNMASACALESGRCSDPVLGMCARELWLFAAVASCTISVHHKPGSTLILADALSRAHLSARAARIMAEQTAQLGLTRVRTRHSHNRFTCNL